MMQYGLNASEQYWYTVCQTSFAAAVMFKKSMIMPHLLLVLMLLLLWFHEAHYLDTLKHMDVTKMTASVMTYDGTHCSSD
jgi:hypothetical protein